MAPSSMSVRRDSLRHMTVLQAEDRWCGRDSRRAVRFCRRHGLVGWRGHRRALL